MIQILDDANVLAEIFDKEFDCLPPHPRFGDVVAIVEDGEIKAFMCREMLIHIGTVWVTPEERKTSKATKWLKALTEYVIVNMPKGSSAVVLDETGLYERLLKFLGLKKSTGQAYRIDFTDK